MKKLLILFFTLLAISTPANAQKLFSKEWKEKQLGVDSVSIAKKQNELAAKDAKQRAKDAKIEAKQTAFFSRIKSPGDGLRISGHYLKQSANYQYGAIGAGAASLGLGIWAANENKRSTRDPLIVSSVIFGIGAFALEIIAIDYKFKSGKVLQFTGNKLQLTF